MITSGCCPAEDWEGLLMRNESEVPWRFKRKKNWKTWVFQATRWCIHLLRLPLHRGFSGGLEIKNQPANAGDSDSIPGLGRAPGEGNGNPLQYYCLGNPMDRGDWLGTVHGVTKELDTINCNNKALQTGWLQQQKFISSHFWRIEIWEQSLRRVDFFWGLSPS